MKSVRQICTIVMLCSGALKAVDNNELSWLRIADQCDQISLVSYGSLTIDDFFIKDDQGNNIYQIALNKHKATGSIACAKMAMILEHYEKKFREKLDKEGVLSEEIVEKLDAVEKTFESPHK